MTPSSQVPYQPPMALVDAERDYLAALCGCFGEINVGRGQSGAVAKAKHARHQYNQRVHELRRTERKASRDGAVQFLSDHIADRESTDRALQALTLANR